MSSTRRIYATLTFKLNAAAVRFRGLFPPLVAAVVGLLAVSPVARWVGAASDSFLGDPAMLGGVLVASGLLLFETPSDTTLLSWPAPSGFSD